MAIKKFIEIKASTVILRIWHVRFFALSKKNLFIIEILTQQAHLIYQNLCNLDCASKYFPIFCLMAIGIFLSFIKTTFLNFFDNFFFPFTAKGAQDFTGWIISQNRWMPWKDFVFFTRCRSVSFIRPKAKQHSWTFC